MALKPIMGQPVNLIPQYEQSFGCDVENKYCVLYGQDVGDETTPSETIMLEMIQEPCGLDLIVDGDFPNGDNWTIVDGDIVFADGKANHVVGASAELSQDIADIDLGTYYKVSVVVTGMSAGTLDIYFTQTGSYSVRITENGIYTFYLYNLGDDDNIDFVWSADCDASISGVSVFKLLDSTEIIANILDLDGNIVTSLPYAIFDEYVVFFKATYTLAEGCYQIMIVDNCVMADELIDVFTDPSFDDEGQWSFSSNSPYTPYFFDLGFPQGTVFYFDSDGTGIPPVTGQIVQPFNLPTGARLYVEFELDGMNAGGGSNIDFILFAEDGGDVQEIITVSGGVNPHKTTVRALVPDNFLSSSNLNIGIMMRDVASGNVNYVGYAQARYAIITNETQGVYMSNCLTVSSDTTGTRIVEGFAELNDLSSNPIKGRSLGFLFVEDYFWLKARLDVSFSNPHNGIKQDNNLFSNGRKKKAFAQVTKLWDLNFIGADENMHDTISNIISCDKFTIESQEYLTDEKDYQPNWNTKSMIDIADSKIEVQKVIGTRFNNND